MKRAIILAALLLTACAPVGSAAPSATATPAPVSLAEQGRALFINKGCVTCHINRRAQDQPGPISSFGPNLTDYRNDPDFLRQWLDNPESVRPGTAMPDLHLAPDEIEALIAFLNQPQ